ncbi:hypothetical protein [Microcoleus sp. FACHB-68]|uniref:hypothetical protein n=1 Tax=Microcoleus sp. FACHB-68 TaxID=2692826 RepID=UPI0016824B73|nr:hypothetical protein [Microcoleus sp. FACHB-68]MBD1940663.1 hypothetical protein [Microcoleus sp. FACHB-68]
MKVNNLDWPEIAEYLALSGAVIGSIVAVASQQVLYSAVPVSLSLLLNLFNRHRWEELTRARLTAAITQLDQKLFSIKALVERRVDDLRMDIAQLNQEAQKIQAGQEVENLGTAMLKLQQQIVSLEQSLEVMSVQLEELTPPGGIQSQMQSGEASVATPVRLHDIHSVPEQDAIRIASQQVPEAGSNPQDVLRRYHW